MTRKLTPTQLDEIEAVAKERVQREWFEPGRSFDPEVVLALVAEVRELEARIAVARKEHVRHGADCANCEREWPCDTIEALGEEA